MVNSHLVCNPTTRQPAFDLTRQQWSLLNHFCTEQGHCNSCRRKRGKTQMMSHSVESCPPTKSHDGLSRLHYEDEDAVSLLTNYRSWHAYEKKIVGLNMCLSCTVTDIFSVKYWCVLEIWAKGHWRSFESFGTVSYSHSNSITTTVIYSNIFSHFNTIHKHGRQTMQQVRRQDTNGPHGMHSSGRGLPPFAIHS